MSKYFKFYLKIFLFLFIVSFLFFCSRSTWTNSLNDTNSPKNSISILFPHIEYIERNENGNIVKRGHSLFVSKTIADIAKEIIDYGDFIPASANILVNSLITCQWIRKYLFKSIINYRNVDDTLMMKQKGKKVFPVTAQLEQLVNKVDTEHYIFINGIAIGASEKIKQIESSQQQTFELYYDKPSAYDYSWHGLVLHIYIIEKKSSEVIWYAYNETSNQRCDPLNRVDLQELMQKLLIRPI